MPNAPEPVPAQAAAPDSSESWTVGRLLTWTTDFLKRKGAESPRLDAEVLLAKVLTWERVKLYTDFEKIIGEQPRAEFRDLVRRRAEGMPVAYLVGRKEFYSLAMAVSPAVLIPRPDSEFVVVEFLNLTKPLEAPRAVDVGTGSGCLALACVHQHKTARFVAIDLSPEALAVAESNAKKLGLTDRIEFRQGDRLGPVAGDAPFDVILSNPPYIPTDVIPTLEPGVRLYEPHTALDGGADGLRVVAPLIAEAVCLLKPGGHLILEIGSDQEKAVRDLIAAQPEFTLAPTIRDHANHPRVVRATRRA
ncbi:peptide chain release factor N(5)-glutamine methyltransferase [Singulisphaera sp. GP187]|uniref:peptide chain release factor N(5)-glutamine methyltransferase n=1 Tax=Singulisphaera sp. GP187 TaxID=1882752 RepID=UPI0009406984|nr:peptide chain release factor N(5)-glutamine methyltransferase [Singulisphaera sp. GP187]